LRQGDAMDENMPMMMLLLMMIKTQIALMVKQNPSIIPIQIRPQTLSTPAHQKESLQQF